MSEIHPAAPLLRTAFANVHSSASEHSPDPELVASCRVPLSDWGASMNRLARVESFIRNAAPVEDDLAPDESGQANSSGHFLSALRRLPVLAVQVTDTTGRTRLLGSSLDLRIDTWVHADESDFDPPPADTVAVGRLLPLNARLWAFLTSCTLPAASVTAFEEVVDSLSDRTLSPDLWHTSGTHSAQVLTTALDELAATQSSSLSQEDRTRLMGVRYGLDTRLLLERGFFNDAGEFKQEDFPVRDIRMMLAENDRTGIEEAIATASRFRTFVLGREPTAEEAAELDSVWPLDDLFAPWHAKADGTLTSSLSWTYRQEPAEVLNVDDAHPLWQAIGENASVGAADRWAERHSQDEVAEAVAAYETECRWIATWGGAEELEAAAEREPERVYDELRAAFIALFDQAVGNVLVRVNGRWKGASQALAKSLKLAPDEMTVARLPRSWDALEKLGVLSPSQRKALAVEMAKIAYSWR